MNNSVTFLFRNLQKVNIKDVSALGYVASRMNNLEAQNEYKIVFWMDGKRHSDWFQEFELEAA